MKSDFYMTLPSNSSMQYFPQNKTTHFQTKLPHEWRLTGDWVVGLSEIQFPQTFSHIPKDNFISMSTITTLEDGTVTTTQKDELIHPGIYNNIPELLDEINHVSNFKDHITFEQEVGGYVLIKKICHCKNAEHGITLHSVFWKIMGFQDIAKDAKIVKYYLNSDYPARLSNALPSVLFIYTDLCESHVTGDVQTPLLRVVPVDLDRYEYGNMRLKIFSAPKYVNLLKTNFETIEIDIRDETGENVPFDHGTLTVTLHFKRIDQSI